MRSTTHDANVALRSAQPPGFEVGPFRVTQHLADGGMGSVWRGFYGDTPIILKALTSVLSTGADAEAAWTHEVRAVASLDHPGVVVVLDHGRIPEGTPLPAGRPFMVMEQAMGTLADPMPDLGWAVLREILIQLLDALAHAHARGVIHRDLKPPNILVFPNGRYKLADFGIAWATSQAQSVHAGTPAYMAPEQVANAWRDFGPWTDLYALGCIAWRLATGGPPFFDLDPLMLMREHMISPPPDFRPQFEVPASFDGWLRKMLEKLPAKRFVRAADALESLLALDAKTLLSPVLRTQRAAYAPTTLHHFWEAELITPTLAEGNPPPIPEKWADNAQPVTLRLQNAGLGLFGLRATRFVGRRAERDVLWQALQSVSRDHRCRVAAVRGPPGIGKSTLVKWLCERAHEVGGAEVSWAWHSDPVGPRDGLLPMVERDLRCQDLDRDGVHDRLRVQLKERPEEVSGLTDWLQPIPGLSDLPRNDRSVRFDLLRKWLTHRAGKRVLILVVDDVQWGEEALAFAQFIRGEPATPVLVLLTVRSDVVALHPIVKDEIDQTVSDGLDLTLDALSGALGPDLVRELLGLAPDLAQTTADRCGGNPLYAVHLVEDWVRRGWLEATPDGFNLREDVEAGIPDAAHDMWTQRVEHALEGLSSEHRTALELAAVLGVDVQSAEWTYACEQPSAANDIVLVEQLERHQLLERHEGGWRWSHGLLVESVIRTTRERGQLQERRDAVAWGLMGHGIDLRYRHNEFYEALSVFERAHQFAEQGSLRQGLIADRAAVVLLLMGRVEQALEHRAAITERVLEAPTAKHTGAVMGHQAYTLFALERHEEAREYARLAMEAELEMGEDPFVGALYQCLIASRQGDFDFVRKILDDPYLLIPRGAFRRDMSRGLVQFEYDVSQGQDPMEGLVRLLALRRDDAPAYDEAGARHAAARLLLGCGRPREARIQAQRTIALATEAQLPLLRGTTLALLARAQRLLGAYDDADATLDDAVECWTGAQHRYGLAVAWAERALNRQARGDCGGARQAVERAAEFAGDLTIAVVIEAT